MFQKLYHSPNSANAQGLSSQQTNDGGYVFLGADSSSVTQAYDAYLVKTDANGDTLWTRIYGSVNNEYGQCVQQTNDGGYIVGCLMETAGDWDIYIVKTNSVGDTLWTKQIKDAGDDNLFSIMQTADLGYIIGGYTNTFGNYDYYLIKTTSTGTISWARNYGTALSEYGYYAQQTSDMGYVIAGTVLTSLSYDVFVVKTDLNGDTLWSKTYGTQGGDISYMVKQTTDGGYIIAGYTSQNLVNTTTDVYLIKTNSAGDTMWTKTYGGANDELGYAVAQTSDGGYIVTGVVYGFGLGAGDVLLLKTDASGNVIFSKAFGETGEDWGYSVQQTTDKGFIIGGYSSSFFTLKNNFYLIKTDSLGDASASNCNQTGFSIPVIIPKDTVTKPGIVRPAVIPGIGSLQTKVRSSGVVNTAPCLNVAISSFSSSKSNMGVYPNPCNGIFNFTLRQAQGTHVQVNITNVFGEIVYAATEENTNGSISKQINLSSLANGTYFIRMQMADKMEIQKLIISR